MEESLLQQYKATTLKHLLKWIENPNDSKLSATLEQNLIADKSRNITKISSYVKKYIASIQQLSSSKKKLMRKVIKHPSNLLNQQFVIDAVHKLKKKQKSSQHSSKVSKRSNQKLTTAPKPFDIQYANPLINVFTVNNDKIKQLHTNINVYKQKLESKNTSDADRITKQLKLVSLQAEAYVFRGQILSKIINKIRKQQVKILQNRKINTLQQILEKLILSKHESKTKSALKLNYIQQNDTRAKKEIIRICSNPNDLDLSRLHTLKAAQNQIQQQKEAMQKSIHDIQTFIDAMRALLNEIIFNQPIECNVWLKLMQSEHNITAATNTLANTSASTTAIAISQLISSPITIACKAPVQIHDVYKKKAKFKRPTKSKAAQAKRISLSDVLPKELCPVQLSQTFLSNGSIRDATKSMFNQQMCEQREKWIREYNMRVVPLASKKYQSLYGSDICLKMVTNEMKTHQVHKTSTNNKQLPPIPAPKSPVTALKKRKLDEIEPNILISDDVLRKKRKLSGNVHSEQSDECVNEIAADEIVDETSVKVPNNEVKERNNKQMQNAVESPSLTQKDTIKKSAWNDDNCLYFMAKGRCGFFKEGKCKYKHPKIYNGKHFYCPDLKHSGECNENDCVYTHNQSDIPCKDYYTAQCLRRNCFRSHRFTKKEYMQWNEARENRSKAFVEWKKNNESNNIQADMKKDEPLTSTTSNEPITSIL